MLFFQVLPGNLADAWCLYFQEYMVTNPEYTEWLQRAGCDPKKPRCGACYQTVDSSHMGEAAVKHQDTVKCMKTVTSVSEKAITSVLIPKSGCSSTASVRKSSLATSASEMLWPLRTPAHSTPVQMFLVYFP